MTDCEGFKLWELFFQIEIFVLTLLVGMVTGVVFQFYQSVMAQSCIGRVVVYCLDFLVWIFIGALVFSLLLIINQGEIRAYVLLALLLGIFTFYRHIAAATKGPIHAAAYLTVRTAGILKSFGSYPVGWIKRQVTGILERFSKLEENDDIEE